jgi:DNA-binding transcriptional regulator YiaG
VGNPDQLDFATKIHLVRVLLNIRQGGMAEALGVTPETISFWETGSREPREVTKRMLTIFAEREGLIWNERGYPEYAKNHSSEFEIG